MKVILNTLYKMLKLKAVLSSVAQLTPKRFFNARVVPKVIRATSHRIPPPCSFPPYVGRPPKPCFDIREVLVERSMECWTRATQAFLQSCCFTRDPTIAGLFIPPDDVYLDCLVEEYTNTGDRWLAFLPEPRTGEKMLIGVVVGNKRSPWYADRLEKCADCSSDPAAIHLYFRAHCYKKPDLFRKYKVPFVYDIEVMGTRVDVSGQGVAQLLLRNALQYTKEMKYPLVQVIAKNVYLNGICKRLNFKHEWKMNYLDLTDTFGKNVLHPRQPHTTVNIFVLQHKT